MLEVFSSTVNVLQTKPSCSSPQERFHIQVKLQCCITVILGFVKPHDLQRITDVKKLNKHIELEMISICGDN